jgi:hypothetical protein
MQKNTIFSEIFSLPTMNDLILQKTDSLPEICFMSTGEMKITGRALPEDAVRFFLPLFEWINGFTGENVNVEINLDYFNTSVSKQLLDLFKMIDKNPNIKNVTVKWMYEEGDEEMLESGEIYQELLPGFTFIFHKYAELAN